MLQGEAESQFREQPQSGSARAALHGNVLKQMARHIAGADSRTLLAQGGSGECHAFDGVGNDVVQDQVRYGIASIPSAAEEIPRRRVPLQPAMDAYEHLAPGRHKPSGAGARA